MGKPDAPDPPDYAAAAQATAAGDLAAAKYATAANRATQNTPFGTSSWTQTNPGDDTNPGWVQNVTLSPEMQSLLQNQTGLSQQYGQQASDLMDRVRAAYSGGFSPPAGLGDVPQLDDRYTQQTYDTIMARQRPQMDYERDRLVTQLRNQGVTAQSTPEAYDAAMRQLNQRQNDLSLGASTQAQSAALQRLQAALTGRERSIQEQAYYQGLPLATVNALRTGSQPTMPTFTNFYNQGQTQGPNLLGAAQAQYGGAVDQYNAQSAAGGNFFSGLFGAGLNAALGSGIFSDRRLKSAIRRIGTLPGGIALYRYRIAGRTELGVMADEVFHVKPHAVSRHPSGFLMVDYARL